eukprot:3775891-Prymnesium_polylepis.2
MQLSTSQRVAFGARETIAKDTRSDISKLGSSGGCAARLGCPTAGRRPRETRCADTVPWGVYQ